MADPNINAHMMYDEQDNSIHDLFEQDDWDGLADLLFAALSDPFLPRFFRAKYHILSAWCSKEPRVHLDLAKTRIENIVEVLKADGQPDEEIDRRLSVLRSMVETAEGAIEEVDVDEHGNPIFGTDDNPEDSLRTRSTSPAGLISADISAPATEKGKIPAGLDEGEPLEENKTEEKAEEEDPQDKEPEEKGPEDEGYPGSGSNRRRIMPARSAKGGRIDSGFQSSAGSPSRRRRGSGR